ncbi:MAG: hypothetical protein PHC75_02915 [Burkholderiales bacterium]|nr:hypothetical protein [Burkholderiales bacterium]
MNHKEKVKTFLELSSSATNPKSIRAIAESIGITEEEAGLAINWLKKNEDVIKVSESGSSEGLQYYI